MRARWAAPIPLLTSPLKGEGWRRLAGISFKGDLRPPFKGRVGVGMTGMPFSLPFKGRVGVGMGLDDE
jgi:hypothetical protein